MHVNFINQHDAGRLFDRLFAEMRIEADHAICNVRDHSNHVTESITKLIHHEFTMLRMRRHDAAGGMAIFQIVPAGWSKSLIHRIAYGGELCLRFL